MMKNILYIFSVFIISNITFGQELFTFNDCLKLAINNNVTIKSAYISEKIAVYQLRTARGQLLPQIDGTVENKYSWGREIDPTTNTFVNKDLKSYTGTLSASLNLFSGFINIKSIRAAKQEVEINKANVQRIKNDITIELAQKYITILYLEETLLVNQEQIKASEKQLEIANLKFKSGVIAESEVFKIQSQKATEELLLINNQNLLASNFIDLKQLMNIPLDRNIELTKPNLLVPEDGKKFENQFSLIRNAIDIHPAFRMSELLAQKAKTDIAIARSSRMPSLTAKFTYGSKYSNNNPLVSFDDQVNENLARGLKLTMVIPIFNQLQTNYRIKERKLAYEQSLLETQLEENKLSKVVLQAINDTKAALKKQESSSIAYEFARKSFDSDQLKFELGKININEINFTKSNFKNAQAELIRAKYELLFNNALINFYLGEAFTL